MRKIARRVFEDSENSGPTVRAFRRSYISAILFGFGAIGGEGFGLPAPSLLAILVSPMFGEELFRMNLVYLAVSFVVLFVIFLFREHYADLKAHRRRHYGRFRR